MTENTDDHLERIELGEFQNEEVNIDGSFFEKCKFRNCVITVTTGKFKLMHNHFQDCRLSLKGEAANVGMLIQLFQERNRPRNPPAS